MQYIGIIVCHVCVLLHYLFCESTEKVGWGIVWYINGILIPEIYLKRGETFTFEVFGGTDPAVGARFHPFYITDDPQGGYNNKNQQEKDVSNTTFVYCSGLPLTGTPLLPKNSVLIREVSFGEREHLMHSRYLLPRSSVSFLRGVLSRECPLSRSTTA